MIVATSGNDRALSMHHINGNYPSEYPVKKKNRKNSFSERQLPILCTQTVSEVEMQN